MTFLDTGILVAAVLENHPEHRPCRETLEEAEGAFTDAQALAETFSTLTGFYKVPVGAASELALGLKELLPVKPLALEDYEDAIGQARARGVMGGGIYDSLHATFARRSGAKCVATLNPSHFAHAAPDLEILTP